jgi:hypothetical protein
MRPSMHGNIVFERLVCKLEEIKSSKDVSADHKVRGVLVLLLQKIVELF